MSIVRTSKTVRDEVNQVDVITNYELKFEFGTLIVSFITENEQGEEQITPTLVQPWKCLPDGSRAAFINEDDAYGWFESAKSYLV